MAAVRACKLEATRARGNRSLLEYVRVQEGNFEDAGIGEVGRYSVPRKNRARRATRDLGRLQKVLGSWQRSSAASLSTPDKLRGSTDALVPTPVRPELPQR